MAGISPTTIANGTARITGTGVITTTGDTITIVIIGADSCRQAGLSAIWNAAGNFLGSRPLRGAVTGGVSGGCPVAEAFTG